MINIDGSDDPTYRYKMPRVEARIEGRGNGIRTNIVNIKDICESIAREPGHATKYLGIELGAQSNWYPDLEKATVQGAHTAADLQKLVLSFAKAFVLCPSCSNPETVLKVKKDSLRTKCSACGNIEAIEAQSHRLATQIVNAERKAKKEGKKDKKDKKDKKAKKSKKSKKAKKSKKDDGAAASGEAEGSSDDEDGGSSDEEDGASEGHAEAASADAAASAGARMETSRGDDGAADVASASALGDETIGAGGGDDEEEEVEGQELAATSACMVEDDLTAIISAAESVSEELERSLATPPAVVALLRRAQTRAMLSPGHRLAIYYLAAMRSSRCLEASRSAVHHKAMLAVLDDAGEKQEALLMRGLCRAVEHDLGAEEPGAARVAPLVLRQLFDGHVLEKAGFDAWLEDTGSAIISEAVREACQPMAAWLASAKQEVAVPVTPEAE